MLELRRACRRRGMGWAPGLRVPGRIRPQSTALCRWTHISVVDLTPWPVSISIHRHTTGDAVGSKGHVTVGLNRGSLVLTKVLRLICWDYNGQCGGAGTCGLREVSRSRGRSSPDGISALARRRELVFCLSGLCHARTQREVGSVQAGERAVPWSPVY